MPQFFSEDMLHGSLWSADSDMFLEQKIGPRRIETVVLSRLKLKWPNEQETFRENNEAVASQIRNLKIITFTNSFTTVMLVLAALVHNLCL